MLKKHKLKIRNPKQYTTTETKNDMYICLDILKSRMNPHPKFGLEVEADDIRCVSVYCVEHIFMWSFLFYIVYFIIIVS